MVTNLLFHKINHSLCFQEEKQLVPSNTGMTEDPGMSVTYIICIYNI